MASLGNQLIAQIRQRLLSTAEPFAPKQVSAERAQALAIRTATTDLSDSNVRVLQFLAMLMYHGMRQRRDLAV
jgi:hypothetical protein